MRIARRRPRIPASTRPIRPIRAPRLGQRRAGARVGATPRGGHGRGDDAFDPTADPSAPGAPKPLGAGESSPPPVADNEGGGAANSDPNAPINLQSAYTPP